jgi:flagellum-specific ATP synthase
MSGPADLIERIAQRPRPAGGYVSGARGLVTEVEGLALPVGGLAEIELEDRLVPAEVVGFRDGRTQLIPLVNARGLTAGARVWALADRAMVPCGSFLLGRVIDGLARPLDGGPAFPSGLEVPLHRDPISPLARPVLEHPLDVGVAALNASATLARGQRVGLFAGAGVGKSTLMGMMTRGTQADVIVIGLIGERGREVREFIERDLAAARQRSVVVAVPADESPLLRMRGAFVATAIAEGFRDEGRDVLLIMDSLTRFGMAAREIGLARSEPTTTKGYPASVFVELARLLERAGRTQRGSITGIYSVLVEGDDPDDPLADSLRAILDGHFVLSRALAERGHFPAIDVLQSVSRAMDAVVTPQHRALAVKMRRLLAAYRDAEDLIQVGAYAKGSDASVDEAIARRGAIESFLRQERSRAMTVAETLADLRKALGEKE